jgi:hypothetical protein
VQLLDIAVTEPSFGVTAEKMRYKDTGIVVTHSRNMFPILPEFY